MLKTLQTNLTVGKRDQIVFRDGDEVRYLTGRVSSTAAAIEMGQTAATWID